MATANSTRASARTKAKDFPLFRHQASGQWCKQINGKRHYFGKDKKTALTNYLNKRDDILAGRQPRPKKDSYVSVRFAVNYILSAKRTLVDAGELSERQWEDIKRGGEFCIKQFGGERDIEDLRPDDFRPLRTRLAKKYNATSMRREITNIRSIFNFAYKNDLIQHPVKFGTQFSVPKKSKLREAKHEAGKRTFEADELRKLLDEADIHLRAMILLGVNCGLGNADCKTLEFVHLDLDDGWLNFPRPKTKVNRRAKLWNETVEALKTSVSKRRKPKRKTHSEIVFITKYGAPWGTPDKPDCPISKQFRKLLDLTKLYEKGKSFYSLRHVFETEAGDTGDQVAVDYVMGHDNGSMANNYRAKVKDHRLEAVAGHVHKWLYAKAKKAKPAGRKPR